MTEIAPPPAVPPQIPVGAVSSVPAVTVVTIESAPFTLQNPPVPIQIEGRVVAMNVDTSQIRVETAQGMIVAQAKTEIPPDARLALTLFLNDTRQLLAKIVVLEDGKITTPPEHRIALPPPPLKIGDNVTAIVLCNPPQSTSPLQTFLSVSDALKNSGMNQSQHHFLSLPAMIQALIAAPSVPTFFNALPESEKQTIETLFSQPSVIPLIKAILPHFQGNPSIVVPQPDMLNDENMLLATYPSQIPSFAPHPVEARSFAAESFLPLLHQQAAQETPFLFKQNIQQTQDTLLVKIIDILPQEKPLAPLTAPVQVGEVVSFTFINNPIVKMEDGRYLLIKTAASISMGSRIVLEQTALPSPSVQTERDDFNPRIHDVWPSLQEALQDAPEIAPVIRATLPSPTAHMTPATLLFLATLRLGEIENWLGSGMQALRSSGRRDLAERLSKDFSKIGEQAKEPLPDGWKSISLPLLYDGQVSQLRFFVRQYTQGKEKNEGDDKKPSTRFLLNLNLRRMGGLQLDGLIHKKSFDMILRSEDVLPLSMRREMMRNFAKGLEQAHMQGSMSFQPRRQGWVSIGLSQHGMTTTV